MTIYDDHLEDVRDLVRERDRDGQACVSTTQVKRELGIDGRIGGRLLARLEDEGMLERWGGSSCGVYRIMLEKPLVTDGGEPIDWPDTFSRTAPEDRQSYPGGFQVTRSEAFQNVLDELARWPGVTDVQLESGAEHQKTNPNKPYARASFDHPGVVVYFTKDGESMAAACDRWDNPRDNAQDLYHYLHETRMQEQRGTVTAESEYRKLRLPSADSEPAAPSPYAVLGVGRDAGAEEIRGAYLEKMQTAHPDKGGSEEEFKRVRGAYETLLEEVSPDA
ncbi:J domain-containing protein [Natronosalvus rutilus]|uniref:J domain-containing protein n=1 Tax=Natronosalvus rutilus TaxID=2953753 RepID=A0A9E7STQ6_9EURY|nr:J domain-containing protein [Natronosalvus rutilus]UTF52780.1 J domain-containing protein [Natronosalvus rutilus]